MLLNVLLPLTETIVVTTAWVRLLSADDADDEPPLDEIPPDVEDSEFAKDDCDSELNRKEVDCA